MRYILDSAILLDTLPPFEAWPDLMLEGYDYPDSLNAGRELTDAMVACWLAATKAGAVVVNTMPMLRAGELTKYVEKAQITHALCDTRLMDEMTACAKASTYLKTVVGFDGAANHDAELDRLALTKSVKFDTVPTAQDDVPWLGSRLGQLGNPKQPCIFTAI